MQKIVSPQSLESGLGSVIALVNEGEIEGAWYLCHAVAVLYADSPAVLQLLAVLSLKRGDPKQASSYAMASLALRSNHVPTLVVAGDAARLLGACEAANTHYAQAHAIQPDRPDICLVSGIAQYQCGQLHRALNALENCVRIAPALADGWFHLALVRQDLHDLPGAILALKRLLQVSPDRIDALVNLGIVLQASERTVEAIQVYGQAYRLQPESFGRIAHALAAGNVGRIWLDLDDLRSELLVSAD